MRQKQAAKSEVGKCAENDNKTGLDHTITIDRALTVYNTQF